MGIMAFSLAHIINTVVRSKSFICEIKRKKQMLHMKIQWEQIFLTCTICIWQSGGILTNIYHHMLWWTISRLRTQVYVLSILCAENYVLYENYQCISWPAPSSVLGSWREEVELQGRSVSSFFSHITLEIVV